MSAMCSEYVGKLESENWRFVLCIILLTPFPIQSQLFYLFILALLFYVVDLLKILLVIRCCL